MVMHGIPELWTTRERRNAGHQTRESIIGAKQDVLGGPWVVATDKAGCLRGDICRLKQPSTASSVGVGSERWSR